MDWHEWPSQIKDCFVWLLKTVGEKFNWSCTELAELCKRYPQITRVASVIAIVAFTILTMRLLAPRARAAPQPPLADGGWVRTAPMAPRIELDLQPNVVRYDRQMTLSGSVICPEPTDESVEYRVYLDGELDVMDSTHGGAEIRYQASKPLSVGWHVLGLSVRCGTRGAYLKPIAFQQVETLNLEDFDRTLRRSNAGVSTALSERSERELLLADLPSQPGEIEIQRALEPTGKMVLDWRLDPIAELSAPHNWVRIALGNYALDIDPFQPTQYSFLFIDPRTGPSMYSRGSPSAIPMLSDAGWKRMTLKRDKSALTLAEASTDRRALGENTHQIASEARQPTIGFRIHEQARARLTLRIQNIQMFPGDTPANPRQVEHYKSTTEDLSREHLAGLALPPP